jgi:hypothetical protein
LLEVLTVSKLPTQLLDFRTVPESFLALVFFLADLFKTSALEGGLLVVGEVGLDRILEVVGGEPGLEVIEGDLVMTTV